jgi:hypothetical protein
VRRYFLTGALCKHFVLWAMPLPPSVSMENRSTYHSEIRPLIFGIAVILVLLSGSVAFAQDVQTNVTYICNGERMLVESCNMRDTSDTSSCMVQHPDRPLHNGFVAYTNETRGALKKLIPTCTQPSADEIARAQARQKKQQDLQNAAAPPATNNQSAALAARNQAQSQAQAIAAASGPKTPEQRAMARCITSGRLPASCTGNSLLGAFSQMISSVLPSTSKEPSPGPNMAGVFQGAGNWRLDFIDNGVLVNCSFLSPDQHSYSLEFKNDHTALIIDTTPKPLVLTLRADGTIVGPGPVTIDGVVASGYTSGNDPTSYSGGYKDENGLSISNGTAASSGAPVYDSLGNRVYHPISAGDAGHTNFASRRATCPALNLSSKGTGVGVQTMQTDLLKTMFGGDKGPPTPPGIRMHGIYAASTGFSVQFYPESAVLGCGPDAARAYPYIVVADGVKAVIKIDAPDHPLALTLKSDGSLEPDASGAYQVHGRIVTGQNDDGDFTFVPMEQSCNLAVLTPSKEIPSGGGSAAAVSASAGAPGVPANNGGRLSTPAAPLGNATLSITSGFPAQPGAPNALGGRPYVLLRDSYENALAKGGVSVPQGVSAFKYVGSICTSRTPDCQKILDAVNASAASAVRADANGSGTFPGVPPGTYYLMISARYNNQALVWEQPVQLKAGANSMTLNQGNATPIN